MELNNALLTKDRAALRRKYRDLRSGCTLAQRNLAAEHLSVHLRRWLKDFTTPQTQIAIYSPMPEEAAFDLGSHTQFFFPRIKGESLEFYRPSGEDAFETHEWGVREPKQDRAQALDLDLPIVVVCPAVTVDTEGRRLGYGKGHYDRFFSAVPQAIRVGVVYQIQVSPDPLPAESWDQGLDWIVTDKMILRTSKRSP